MTCNNCGYEKIDLLCTDTFVCHDCDSSLDIKYWSCGECGFNWRTNGGVFEDGEVLKIDDIQAVMDDVFKIVLPDNGSESIMSDMVHSCLLCEAAAFTDNNLNFCCSVCGYEWEVLTSA